MVTRVAKKRKKPVRFPTHDACMAAIRDGRFPRHRPTPVCHCTPRRRKRLKKLINKKYSRKVSQIRQARGHRLYPPSKQNPGRLDANRVGHYQYQTVKNLDGSTSFVEQNGSYVVDKTKVSAYFPIRENAPLYQITDHGVASRGPIVCSGPLESPASPCSVRINYGMWQEVEGETYVYAFGVDFDHEVTDASGAKGTVRGVASGWIKLSDVVDFQSALSGMLKQPPLMPPPPEGKVDYETCTITGAGESAAVVERLERKVNPCVFAGSEAARDYLRRPTNMTSAGYVNLLFNVPGNAGGGVAMDTVPVKTKFYRAKSGIPVPMNIELYAPRSPSVVGHMKFVYGYVLGANKQRRYGWMAERALCCDKLALKAENLRPGKVGEDYSARRARLSADGRRPQRFAFAETPPPAWLKLSPDGTLSGVPDAAGEVTFKVEATDHNDCTGRGEFKLVVCPLVNFEPAELPDAVRGRDYQNVRLKASGFAGRHAFTLVKGRLPSGLELTPGGRITGRPKRVSQSTFTVKAADEHCEATHQYTLRVVCPPLTLAPASCPGGVVNATYPRTVFTVAGGVPPYRFAPTAPLPPGLRGVPDQERERWVLAGRPTAPGHFAFNLSVTDKEGCVASQSYEIDITAPTGSTP